MRRIPLIVLAATAVIALAVAAALPPAALHLRPSPESVVAGAFHVHTNRSDGSGSVEEIAAAAARAGLRFVIFTDHGNGTRAPEPPAYRSGVLTIDGVEISTAGGHYAVVGMRRAPYPLGGETRDVVEDVRRLGGFGIVAHGDSPRTELQWDDWRDDIDGLEWLSLDTAWRRASSGRLAAAWVTYWFRQPESVAAILNRPDALLARFDELAQARPTVAMASTDAHGLWAPSYEACFRTMTTRVELAKPLTGDATADADALITALRAGHHYSAIDAFATPPSFEFRGYREADDRDAVTQGDRIAPDARAILQARVAGEGASLTLVRNGEIVREARAQTLIHQTDGRPGTYRVEARLPGFDVPWLLSNPIYVGAPEDIKVTEAVQPAETIEVLAAAKRSWTADHDPRSNAAIEQHGTAARFHYELGGGEPRDQFASMMVLVPGGIARYDRLMIDAAASRPLRMSVQLVEDQDGRWLRWQRSVYIDRERRTITVLFNDMRPVPALDKVDALVFLIDTNNTTPGTSGEIIFNRVAYQR